MANSILKTNELFKIAGINPHEKFPTLQSQCNYTIQSINPIYYEIAAVWLPTGQENKVSSSAGSLDVQARDGSCCQFTAAYAAAETQFSFKPITEGEITLKFTGHVDMHAFENSVTFKLEEMNGGIIIDDKKWTVEEAGQLEIDEELSYTVNPSSEYRITLTATVNCGEITGAWSRLILTI